MLAAVIEDLLLDGVRRLAAGAQDDEGLDLLHLVRVLDADDAGQEDLFVAVDDVFQLAGIDVVAGGDDHALDALGEVDEAVLVHLAEVTGVQPDAAVVVAAEGVMGLLGIVDVLEHDGGAGDADLALEIGVELLRGAGLDDLVVGIGERDADGADAVIILRGQAGGRDALGQAVALTDLHGGMVHFQELVDLLLELDGHAVAAGEDALQAAEVGVFELFGAQKGLKQGRDAGDDVRLLLDEQVGVGIDVELRDKDAACAADEGGMDADAEAEAVEHGHDGEHLHAVDGREAGGRDGLQAKGVEVHVGEQNALGRAGGTAGIEDGRAVFRAAVVLRQGQIALFAHALEFGPPDVIAVLRGLRILARGGEGVAEGQMRIELVLNFGEQELTVFIVKLGHDGGDLGVELVERQDAFGVREVEIELDLARGGERMDHVGDRADAVEAVECMQGLRAVGHADGHAVAFLDAHGEEGLGGLVDLFHELREGGLLAHELIGGEPGVADGGVADHLIDGLLRVSQVMRHLAVIFQPGSGSGKTHFFHPFELLTHTSAAQSTHR